MHLYIKILYVSNFTFHILWVKYNLGFFQVLQQKNCIIVCAFEPMWQTVWSFLAFYRGSEVIMLSICCSLHCWRLVSGNVLTYTGFLNTEGLYAISTCWQRKIFSNTSRTGKWKNFECKLSLSHVKKICVCSFIVFYTKPVPFKSFESQWKGSFWDDCKHLYPLLIKN